MLRPPRPTAPWLVQTQPHWLQSYFWPPAHGSLPRVVQTPRCTTAELWEFLHKGLSEIHSYGLPSTIGHRFYSDMSKYPHGDKPQFHYYPRSYNQDPIPLVSYTARGAAARA